MDSAMAERLLAFVRGIIRSEVNGDAAPARPPDLPDRPHGGAFVTLKKRGRLRGCMGTFTPCAALADTLESAARSAARDPRFRACPVGADELADCRIDVSILSAPERTDRPAALEVGRHGIWIRRGAASGCFLPQAATEHRWTAEEFLANCCAMKAGLAPGAWQDPRTEVWLFTAEIVAERD